MEHCTFHLNHVAIEKCEICERPLCGHCLWYTESGHRYCEDHAKDAERQGLHIFSPDTYAEAVESSLNIKGAYREKEGDIPYRGNSQDMNSFLAAGIGVITLLSCVGGVYCLPIVGLVLGIIAYSNADQAVDPQRTRRLAGVGIAVGGFVILVIVALIAIYIAIFGAAFAFSSTSP